MVGSSDDAALTLWIERLRAGDQAAASAIWDHFFSRLRRLARQQLQSASRRVADEEDIAACVFESFFRGLQAGRFDQLHDRHGLWALLLAMTRRKVIDHRRRERRLRRGEGKTRGDSVFAAGSPGFDGFVGPESIPELFAEIEERLEALADEQVRSIVLLRLQGYSTGAIAAELEVSRRTVERRLQFVRDEWEFAEADA
jgi:RNA polymerase sigma factor (sigma-70 family)